MKAHKRGVPALRREGLFKRISAWGVSSNIAACIVVLGVAAIVFCMFLRFQTFGIGAVLPWYSQKDAYGYESLLQIENRNNIVTAYTKNIQEKTGSVSRQYDAYLFKAGERYAQVMQACKSAVDDYLEQQPDFFIDSSFVQNQDCLEWKLMFYQRKDEEFIPVPAKQSLDLLVGLVGSPHIQNNVYIDIVGFQINGSAETNASIIRSIQRACAGLTWNKDVYFQLDVKEGEEVQQENVYVCNINY